MEFMQNGLLHHLSFTHNGESSFIKETINRWYSWAVSIQSIRLKEAERDIVHGFHESSWDRVSRICKL